MAWATPAEVLAVTGVPVSAEQVSQATRQVELYAGRLESQIPNPATTSAREGHWLSLAVSYQAAAIAEGRVSGSGEQLDDASSFSIDGLSVTRGSGSTGRGGSTQLVPLALRALANVRWLRRGSRRVGIAAAQSPDRTVAIGTGGDDDEVVDQPWVPL